MTFNRHKDTTTCSTPLMWHTVLLCVLIYKTTTTTFQHCILSSSKCSSAVNYVPVTTVISSTSTSDRMLSTNAEIHGILVHANYRHTTVHRARTYLSGIKSPQPLTNCGCLVIHSSARNRNKPMTQSSGHLHTQKKPVRKRYSTM